MAKQKSKTISVLEFRCLSPLRFFEHCAACPRFKDDCQDLEMIKEVLRGKKEIAYGEDPDEDSIHVSAFKCLAPLNYIERGRSRCPHEHRCREEGLLLALLDGKKTLDYSKTRVVEFPRRRASEETHRAA